MSKHTHSRSRSFTRFVFAALTALSVATFAGPPSAEAQRRPESAAAATTAAPSDASPGVVNIQTATPQELERLPGIGPAKAAAILEHREARAFRRVEDLMRVRGIGRATFRRLRPMLTITGATTLTERPRPTRRTPVEAEEAEAESD